MIEIRPDRRSLGRLGTISFVATGLVVVMSGAFSTRAQAAPTAGFVKTVGTAVSKTEGGTLTISVPAGGVAAGHSLIVTMVMDEGAGTISVTDSRNNTYRVDAEIMPVGATFRTAIVSAHNITALSAGDVITISLPVVRAKAASVAEFSGLAASNALDQSQGVGGSGSSAGSGAVSTSQADELLIGAIGVEGPIGDSFTPGDTGAPAALPFSSLQRAGTTGSSAVSNVTIDPEYRIVTQTGSYAARGALAPNRPWGALIATYRVDVTAPTPTVDLRSPSVGTYVATRTPSFGGSAGTLNSDASVVSLKILQGGATIRSSGATRVGGSWGPVTVSPALPADGAFTAMIEQSDQATNRGSASIVFTVDTTPPSSFLTPLPAARTSDVVIDYTVADGTGSGVQDVELWAKGPNDHSFTLAQVDTSPATPTFTYAATGGDGTYDFYTRARDDLGNYEDPAATPDATTRVDSVEPASSAADIAEYSITSSLSIPFSATDDATGVAEVELWLKRPGDTGFAQVATGTSSPFTYVATAGDGTYEFYTRARDHATNREDAPAGADTSTIVDTARPASTANELPAQSAATRAITYATSDATSGVASVQLWVREPGGGFALEATDPTPSTPRFDFTATVNGMHEFYTVAVDRAGNAELAPALGMADSSSTFDIEVPASSADPLPDMTSEHLTIGFTASDTGPSGVATVELWVKEPSDEGFRLLATDDDPLYPSFEHTATEDGIYEFYTRARDAVGNYEDAASEPDASTTVEMHDPVSTLEPLPAFRQTRTIDLTYTASDVGAGVDSVDLWVRGPDDDGFTLAGTDPTPNDTRAFTYTATEDGRHAFYTRAHDGVGHQEAAPEIPDVTVTVDSAAPGSIATAPATAGASIAVGYAASDVTSGLREVRLYAKGPNDPGFELAATDATPDATRSFGYAVSQGVGRYDFYTRAVDRAGNVEDPPDEPDASTVVDDARPVSAASSPTTSNAGFTVDYAAADTGAGLDEVALYVRGPSDDTFASAAMDADPEASGSFEYVPTQGDGDYDFYTIARDLQGNVEAEPATPDTTTTIDTIDPITTDDAVTGWHTQDFTVRLSATDDNSGVARTEYRIDGTGSDPFLVGNLVAIDVDDLGDGSHTIYYRSVDVANNEETTKTATVRVDTRDPTTTDDADGAWHRSDLDITLRASDPGAGDAPPTGSGIDRTEYRVGAGAFAPGNVVAIDADTLGSGIHTIDYASIDAAGNREPLRSTTVKVDVAAPRTTDDYDGGWHNDDVTVSLAALDAHSGVDETSYSTDGGTTYSVGESVTIAATGADGTHDIAYYSSDVAGNVEVPASVTVRIDTAAPTSSATEVSRGTDAIAVEYAVADERSGVASLELYVKRPSDDAFGLAGTHATPNETGSFTYSPDGGPGTYRFYTIAVDDAGNREGAPEAADGELELKEGTAPASKASAPALTRLGTFRLSYVATDPGQDASGVASVELWVKPPGEVSFVRYGEPDTDPSTTYFDFVVPVGTDGIYSFYTVARDAAGNVETDLDPELPDARTTVDRIGPSISKMRAGPNPFYLNRDTRAKITFAVGEASSIRIVIRKGRTIVRRLAGATPAGPQGLVRYWNGKSTAGKRVGSGRYLIRVSATDAAGNVRSKGIYIKVVA